MAGDAAAALREKALAALRDVLKPEPGRPYALLDFPCGRNVGDSAIWLGTRAALASLGMGPPAYMCDDRTFEPDVLRRCVGDGLILLLGGGNFGDLFPKHQRLREGVVSAFPNHRIVQLPQSIHFASAEADGRARIRHALSHHRRLTVMARDRGSLDAARKDLGLDAVLCPDLAVTLGPRARRPDPERRILWLARFDAWRIHKPPDSFAARDALVSDWPLERTSVGRLRVRWLSSWLRRGHFRGLPLRRWLSSGYDPLARRRVGRAFEWMSSASVVVTDRLHGHVLAMLLGVPHVLLDDATGKVRAYYDAWLTETPGIAWAETADEAAALARLMLDGLSNSPGDRA